MNKEELKKRTIVHVSPYYPPHIGGLERVAKTSAEGLEKLGYKVQVVTSSKSGLKSGTKKNGNLKVTTLKSFEFAHTPIAPTFFWYLLWLPKNSLIHLHLSQAYYPELILLLFKIRRIPYIAHFHLDVGPSGFFGSLFLIYKKLCWEPILRNAKMVIACSSDQAAIVQTKYNVAKEKVIVIPNFVGQDFFSKSAYVAATDKLRLLYVGRIAIQKRIERLINAVAAISVPVQLTIVGDGEELPKLKELAKKLKLENVFFEGRKNDQEMQVYHQNSDLFLISSDREGGTPLVALEAMAAGLPIVGTDVTGVRELLQGVGILVEEPYAENFSKVIEDLWKKPAELNSLSLKSLGKAKQYSEVDYIKRLEEVYIKLL